MSKEPLYPHVPKRKEPLYPHRAKTKYMGSFDIKPVDMLEREYEEFIKPYWDRIGDVLVTSDALMKLPIREQNKLFKERAKREREIKRAKDYQAWRGEQEAIVPQVRLVKFDHIWEKCPNCGSDVGSVWPPRPAIHAFDLKESEHDEVPLVPIFKCTICEAVSADYNRYVYVRREWIKGGRDV